MTQTYIHFQEIHGNIVRLNIYAIESFYNDLKNHHYAIRTTSGFVHKINADTYDNIRKAYLINNGSVHTLDAL